MIGALTRDIKKLNSQAFAQSEVVTTTEDLLAAQHELTVGHEFVETLLQVNRNIISMYIEVVTTQLLDSFMDTYSEIHNIQESVLCIFTCGTLFHHQFYV